MVLCCMLIFSGFMSELQCSGWWARTLILKNYVFVLGGKLD